MTGSTLFRHALTLTHFSTQFDRCNSRNPFLNSACQFCPLYASDIIVGQAIAFNSNVKHIDNYSYFTTVSLLNFFSWFLRQFGNWCREHNVTVGHIIHVIHNVVVVYVLFGHVFLVEYGSALLCQILRYLTGN